MATGLGSEAEAGTAGAEGGVMASPVSKEDRLARWNAFLDGDMRALPECLADAAKVLSEISGLVVTYAFASEQLHTDDPRRPNVTTETELRQLLEQGQAIQVNVESFVRGDIEPEGVLVLRGRVTFTVDEIPDVKRPAYLDLALFELAFRLGFP